VESFRLTDWVVVQGASTIGSITQSADSWLDLADYEDVQLYIDIKDTGAFTVTMNYETSLTRQEQGFVAVVPPFAMSAGLRVDQAPFSLALNPVARFLRWRVSQTTATSTWQATFRIWVLAYSHE